MRTSTLLKKIQRYKELQAQKTEIEVEMTSLKEEFEQEMIKEQVGELIVEAYKISYLQYTRREFDKKKFKETHKRMYENFCYDKEIKSVVVK